VYQELGQEIVEEIVEFLRQTVGRLSAGTEDDHVCRVNLFQYFPSTSDEDHATILLAGWESSASKPLQGKLFYKFRKHIMNLLQE
jgi:lauroyl/myristoyl acyltransferase